MSSQDKILQNPEDSLFNHVDNTRLIGIIFFIVSLLAHGLFFGSLIFFHDFKFSKPMPPVIQIDLVSFTPESALEDPLEKEVKSEKNDISIKKSTIKKKIKKIPAVKPDISLKAKPKNSKELIAAKKKKSEQIIKKKPDKKVLKEAKDQSERKLDKQNQDILEQAFNRLKQKVNVQNTKSSPGPGNGYEKKGYKPIDLYKMVLGSAIEQNWVFSDVLARMDQDLEVRILIRILKSGIIRDIIFETRSGNRYLDESAKKAIKKANPLPRLPAGMASYDVVVIFTPGGLK